MDVLREVVREPAPVAGVGVEGVGRHDAQVEEERGDEGGDEGRGGAEARFVHVGEAYAGGEEGRELGEGGECWGQVTRSEL